MPKNYYLLEFLIKWCNTTRKSAQYCMQYKTSDYGIIGGFDKKLVLYSII